MEKSIPTIIMLVAGATACICCLVNGVGLLTMLEIILVVLIVFFIIGKIAGHIVSKTHMYRLQRSEDLSCAMTIGKRVERRL